MNWVVKSHMMQQYMKAFKKILDYTCKATNGGDVFKIKKKLIWICINNYVVSQEEIKETNNTVLVLF